MSGWRLLTPFVYLIFTIAGLILFMAALILASDGMSIDLIEALALLAACLTVLLITHRLDTGRWFRWSRR
ncbi:hypothetical protein [Streptomyces sp. 7N604]|uniref:hypothetical protein n=1 Tax=Streptomyces sp. 7N604 TaxID=3457415 RepID=UPI003FCF9CD7